MMFSARPALLATTALAALALSGCSASAPATAATGSATAAPAATTAGTAPPRPTSTAVQHTYTLAQVRPHDSFQSCWVVIEQKVYDLTPWIHRHPGGTGVIEKICGTDGTTAFNAEHGDEGPNGGPQTLVAQYQIGTIAP